jgi:NADPH:quinone reductase-like Zn-dependent oxidoreductase
MGFKFLRRKKQVTSSSINDSTIATAQITYAPTPILKYDVDYAKEAAPPEALTPLGLDPEGVLLCGAVSGLDRSADGSAAISSVHSLDSQGSIHSYDSDEVEAEIEEVAGRKNVQLKDAMRREISHYRSTSQGHRRQQQRSPPHHPRSRSDKYRSRCRGGGRRPQRSSPSRRTKYNDEESSYGSEYDDCESYLEEEPCYFENDNFDGASAMSGGEEEYDGGKKRDSRRSNDLIEEASSGGGGWLSWFGIGGKTESVATLSTCDQSDATGSNGEDEEDGKRGDSTGDRGDEVDTNCSESDAAEEMEAPKFNRMPSFSKSVSSLCSKKKEEQIPRDPQGEVAKPKPFGTLIKNKSTRNADMSDEGTASVSNESRITGLDMDVRQRDVYYKHHGGVENIVIRQFSDVPTVKRSDHVMVKVKVSCTDQMSCALLYLICTQYVTDIVFVYQASTVSPKDCLLRMKGDASLPSVPGFQVVGEVLFLGDKVKASGVLKRGDRIAALTNGYGNAKYISLPAHDAIVIPSTATHEDIICLISNYMTAYQSLKLAKKDGAPLTNANVLITGGSGPVGQALIDLASREGAKIFTTAHKMHEAHLVHRLGARWYPINPQKWLPLLRGKMDVVIDSLCVDGYESSYEALTPEGVLVATGNISAALDQIIENESFCNTFESNNLKLWWSHVKAKYIWSRSVFYDVRESYERDPRMFKQELLYLICKLEKNEIRPKVAGRVSLNQVPKAQSLIEKGLPNGTVICLPWKQLDPKQEVSTESK